MAARSFKTPVEVSEWVKMTALIVFSVSAASLARNSSGSKAFPHSAVISSTTNPKALLTLPQRSPNLPLFPTKMRSPGLRKLIIPASIAPVPLAVSIRTSFWVWWSHLRLAVNSAIILLNSPLRWPMGCFAIASKTFSGTGVGPGIINICLLST